MSSKKTTIKGNQAKKPSAPVKNQRSAAAPRKVYDYDASNVSNKIKPGQIIQTDEKNVFLVKGTRNAKANKSYSKTGTASRPQVVIDTNNHDELATVNLTTQNGIPLPNKPQSKFRPFVEIYDDEKKPIKIGNKFYPKNKKITQYEVDYIRDECINHPKKSIRNENRKRLRKLKNK